MAYTYKLYGVRVVLHIMGILCVFVGAVKLWLEQEGEAQFCSKCRGLHAQVQPGKIHAPSGERKRSVTQN